MSWSLWVGEWGQPRDEFWDLTPREWASLVRGSVKRSRRLKRELDRQRGDPEPPMTLDFLLGLRG